MFCQAISGRVISSWCHILNLVTITEPIEYLACKLGTVIMDDPPRDTKSMDDIVFDEINHVESFDFNQCIASAYFEK